MPRFLACAHSRLKRGMSMPVSDHDALEDEAKYASVSVVPFGCAAMLAASRLCDVQDTIADALVPCLFTVPTEFTSVPFPVKALKLLLHDLQSGGEAASMGFSAKDVSEIASDDGVSTLLSHSTLRVSSMKHRAPCIMHGLHVPSSPPSASHPSSPERPRMPDISHASRRVK